MNSWSQGYFEAVKRQHIDRRQRVVDHAAAMVGKNDGIYTAVGGKHSVPRLEQFFDYQRARANIHSAHPIEGTETCLPVFPSWLCSNGGREIGHHVFDGSAPVIRKKGMEPG